MIQLRFTVNNSVTKRDAKAKKQKKKKKTGVKYVIFLTLSVHVAWGRGGG